MKEIMKNYKDVIFLDVDGVAWKVEHVTADGEKVLIFTNCEYEFLYYGDRLEKDSKGRLILHGDDGYGVAETMIGNFYNKIVA